MKPAACILVNLLAATCVFSMETLPTLDVPTVPGFQPRDRLLDWSPTMKEFWHKTKTKWFPNPSVIRFVHHFRNSDHGPDRMVSLVHVLSRQEVNDLSSLPSSPADKEDRLWGILSDEEGRHKIPELRLVKVYPNLESQGQSTRPMDMAGANAFYERMHLWKTLCQHPQAKQHIVPLIHYDQVSVEFPPHPETHVSTTKMGVAVMDYARGGDYAELMKAADISEHIWILVRLGRAIQFLHSQGVAHGNIYSRNVLIQISLGFFEEVVLGGMDSIQKLPQDPQEAEALKVFDVMMFVDIIDAELGLVVNDDNARWLAQGIPNRIESSADLDKILIHLSKAANESPAIQVEDNFPMDKFSATWYCQLETIQFHTQDLKRRAEEEDDHNMMYSENLAEYTLIHMAVLSPFCPNEKARLQILEYFSEGLHLYGNVEDSFKYTPIHYAGYYLQDLSAQYIFSQDLDSYASEDMDGRTYLHLAVAPHTVLSTLLSPGFMHSHESRLLGDVERKRHLSDERILAIMDEAYGGRNSLQRPVDEKSDSEDQDHEARVPDPLLSMELKSVFKEKKLHNFQQDVDSTERARKSFFFALSHGKEFKKHPEIVLELLGLKDHDEKTVFDLARESSQTGLLAFMHFVRTQVQETMEIHQTSNVLMSSRRFNIPSPVEPSILESPMRNPLGIHDINMRHTGQSLVESWRQQVPLFADLPFDSVDSSDLSSSAVESFERGHASLSSWMRQTQEKQQRELNDLEMQFSRSVPGVDPRTSISSVHPNDKKKQPILEPTHDKEIQDTSTQSPENVHLDKSDQESTLKMLYNHIGRKRKRTQSDGRAV